VCFDTRARQSAPLPSEVKDKLGKML